MASFRSHHGWRNDPESPQAHASTPTVHDSNPPISPHNAPAQASSSSTTASAPESRIPTVMEVFAWLRRGVQSGHPPGMDTIQAAFGELDHLAQSQAAPVHETQVQAAQMQATQLPTPPHLDVGNYLRSLRARVQHSKRVLERRVRRAQASHPDAELCVGSPYVVVALDALEQGVSQRLLQMQAPSFDSLNAVPPPETRPADLEMAQQQSYSTTDIRVDQFPVQDQQAQATHDAPLSGTAQDQPTTPTRKLLKDRSNEKKQHAVAGKSRVTKVKAKKSRVNQVIAQEAFQDMDDKFLGASPRAGSTRPFIPQNFSSARVDEPIPTPQTPVPLPLIEPGPSMPCDWPQVTAESPSTIPYLEASQSEPQATAEPPSTDPSPDDSQSEPQATEAKEPNLLKRTFDQYMDDETSPPREDGRGDFFKSFIYNPRAFIKVAAYWISACCRRLRGQQVLGLTSMSNKRRITIPGAWPESPKSLSPAPARKWVKSAVEQTPSKIIPARAPSPSPSRPTATPKTPPPSHVKLPKTAGWTKPALRRPWSPDTPRSATTGMVSQGTPRYSGQEEDLDLPMSRRVNSAQKTAAALSQRQQHSVSQPGLPPPHLFAESDVSRPTSSGTDSSVSLGAPSGETKAITPAAVEPKVGSQELELSGHALTAKVVAEVERRRQEDERRAAEEKRAAEERRAREEAEELARQAARAAEIEAALSAMSPEERQVLERSRGLFKVLPQAHRETLQRLVQREDTFSIKGNFYAKDLRTMTAGVAQTGRPRPWLNDEAVLKGMEYMCSRANEKLGFSKVKGGPAAPFHGYSPMWWSSANGFGVSSLNTWFRKANHDGEKLRQTRAVFLPICDRDHWRLVVISGQNRTIQYLDSMWGNGDRYINLVKQVMQAMMKEHWDESEWTVIKDRKSPRQRNGSDCGMFTLLNMATIIRGREVAEDSYDDAVNTIDYARNWFASAIIHEGFTDDFDWEDDEGLAMA
ncbi:hypothetical protein HDK90DRAFT_552456 [Phyllosticta capitalensis]|uniref:Ubiquitin-like protease family profile domain-containing protein n=1 Tax=Phyllosticta capitalensis TaxID=121624 RepID=A0ABR1YQM7_9PEZI